MEHSYIDLDFPICGEEILVDHGYLLFCGLSKVMSEIHDRADIAISPIKGKYSFNGKIELTKNSCLTLRIPDQQISKYLQLTGKKVYVGESELLLKAPVAKKLIPASSLYSHIVTTKNGNDETRFREEITRQLKNIKISGQFIIGKRKTISIHQKKIVCYSMLVTNLTAQESITLQEFGLGGRRKMTCGFFVPWKGS